MTLTPSQLRRWLRPATALLIVVLAACTTTVRKHPEFSTRIARVSSVGVMPAQVHVEKIVFRGDNEPLHDMSERIAAKLPSLVARYLAEHDLSVTEIELTDDLYAEFPDLRFEITQIEQAASTALREMYETVEMTTGKAESYERSIGPEVSQLAEFLQETDALIFARMEGFKKSEGEVAKDLAFTVLLAAATLGNSLVMQPSQGAVLQVCLIDSTTGEVLWANTQNTPGDFEGKGLEKLVEALFKKFER